MRMGVGIQCFTHASGLLGVLPNGIMAGCARLCWQTSILNEGKEENCNKAARFIPPLSGPVTKHHLVIPYLLWLMCIWDIWCSTQYLGAGIKHTCSLKLHLVLCLEDGVQTSISGGAQQFVCEALAQFVEVRLHRLANGRMKPGVRWTVRFPEGWQPWVVVDRHWVCKEETCTLKLP